MALGHGGVLKINNSVAQYVSNLNIPLSAEEADKTSRADQGWKNRTAGQRQWGLTFTYVGYVGDTVYAAMLAAFVAGSTVTVHATDALGHVVEGTASITQFDKDESLGGHVSVSVGMVGGGRPTTIN